MKHLINTGTALALLICRAPDGASGSEPAKTPETKTEPEKKPEPAAEAPKSNVTHISGQTTAKSTTSPTGPKTDAKKPDSMKPKSVAVAKKKVEETPKRRESKIAPIQTELVALLKKGSMTVQALSAKLKCTELQVRQAIDRARAGNGPEAKINRVARNTFGYEKPKRS